MGASEMKNCDCEFCTDKNVRMETPLPELTSSSLTTYLHAIHCVLQRARTTLRRRQIGAQLLDELGRGSNRERWRRGSCVVSTRFAQWRRRRRRQRRGLA